MLLRVSSNQQLEADGDLSVQRQIVTEYAAQFADWQLDGREYFEGSSSGYKRKAADREILQEILADARRREFDLLVCYKDDRVGRRMWEIGSYIMNLKSCGVDVYTVKDGCITPNEGDMMGQMMLALRYGNAEKSSFDTGIRVRDNAQKLVERGRFMGGLAPYGYQFELSGELSKHGRALHKLVIIPEKAEVVRYIYALSLYREFGSARIAAILNQEERYRNLAPHDEWKSGTITGILTNPVYAGHVAYKCRERVNGRYHRLDSTDWILSKEANESIRIIDSDTWNRVQEKRKLRSVKYGKHMECDGERAVIRRNDGALPLIDVLCCGYCGRKMTNGSRYSYWTIKATGERRKHKIPFYKCQTAQTGMLHRGARQCRAEEIEKIVFACLAEYIEKSFENGDLTAQIEQTKREEKKAREWELRKAQTELEKVLGQLKAMEKKIPDAVTGQYPLSLEELTGAIRRHQALAAQLREKVDCGQRLMQQTDFAETEHQECRKQKPTWRELFLNADGAAKRLIVDKMIARIDVTEEQITVRFCMDVGVLFL